MAHKSSKSEFGTLVDPMIADIMSRFQQTGSASVNATLACDPSGYAAVPEELLDAVDYPRPPFNWPFGNSPYANYFALQGMAIDTLVQAGFSREASALKKRLTYLGIPDYEQQPALFHRFLDFEPVASDPTKIAEIEAFSQKMGIDSDALKLLRKKPVKNALAHKKMGFEEEWAWLVEHADVENSFGKTAACHLSAGMVSHLVQSWHPKLSAQEQGDPNDPSYLNKAWFDRAFPMGWILPDRLHQTACVSIPMSFPERMGLIAYELEAKASRGMSRDEIARFAFDHTDEIGLRGSAIISIAGIEAFKGALKIIARPRRPEPATAYVKLMQALNPGMGNRPEELWAWLAYRLIDPEASSLIQEQVISNAGELSELGFTSKSKALAAIEKIELDAMGLNLRSDGIAAPAALSTNPSRRL